MKPFAIALAAGALAIGAAYANPAHAKYFQYTCQMYSRFPAPTDESDPSAMVLVRVTGDAGDASWLVVANNKYDRSDQYAMHDLSNSTRQAWGGRHRKNLDWYMVGEIFGRGDEQLANLKPNQPMVYTETLYDTSRNNEIALQRRYTCLVMQNDWYVPPPPAPTVTAGNQDAVPIMVVRNSALVSVMLGSMGATMIIDTGASIMVVTPQTADRLVANREAREDGSGKASLADGRVITERRIVVSKIQIGAHALTDVEAAVTPDNEGVDELLPFSVLSRFGKFSLDIPNRKLIFG